MKVSLVGRIGRIRLSRFMLGIGVPTGRILLKHFSVVNHWRTKDLPSL